MFLLQTNSLRPCSLPGTMLCFSFYGSNSINNELNRALGARVCRQCTVECGQWTASRQIRETNWRALLPLRPIPRPLDSARKVDTLCCNWSQKLLLRSFVSLRTFCMVGASEGSLWLIVVLHSWHQGVTNRCSLSWIANSALVYEPKYGGGGELRGISQ
jgi:hypothetical protein